MNHVYLIPNTHSDLQYLKSFRDYLPLHLSNLKAGLDMLARFPDYRYLTEHIALLDMFWRRNPAYRARIRRFAREGRLDISPNLWCICDVNMPSGESLARQMECGQRWTQRYLGMACNTAWLADVFGLNAQMPQLLKRGGYELCAFTRGVASPDRPNPFLWEGLDHSRIPTVWQTRGYGGCGPFGKDPKTDHACLEQCIEDSSKGLVGNIILMGHGGDFITPRPVTLRRVRAWNRRHGNQVRLATTSEYREALMMAGVRLPIWKGDLNPTMQGCYSVRIRLK